ncbi:MAG: tetratricopeptide repeat protein, partial [Methanobacteriota archaeon]
TPIRDVPSDALPPPASSSEGDSAGAAAADDHDPLACLSAVLRVRASSMVEDMRAEMANDVDTCIMAAEILGQRFFDNGRYQEALLHYTAGLMLLRTKQGGLPLAQQVESAGAANNVAVTLCKFDKFREAAPLLRYTFHVRAAAFGPEHEEVLSVATNYAALLAQAGDPAAAIAFMDTVLDGVRDAAGGNASPAVAAVLQNKGNVQLMCDDHAGAQASYRDALHICERAHGRHVDTAAAMSNLAICLCTSDGCTEHDLSEAETLLLSALDMRESVQGQRHADVGITLSNLGTLFSICGRTAEARTYLTRAVSVLRASLGAEDAETQKAVARLDALPPVA